MKKLEFGDEKIYLSNDRYLTIYHLIKEKKYTVIKELKKDRRSLVLLIELVDSSCGVKKVVLKIPKEKNEKKWQRFLSIFRGSESKREFASCEFIKEKGFLGADPIIAVETVKNLVVRDSYFVLSYIEGKHGSFNDILQTLNMLYRIHDLGYTHGDPQLPNFMVEGDKVYLIDCKLEKIRMGIISKINEFIYFEKSCHKEVDSRYKKMKLFPILKKFDEIKDRFNYFTKKIRGKPSKERKN